MDSATADAVRKWKSHKYTPTDIPFADAVHSLSTRQPLIEAKHSAIRPVDWVFCYPGTSTPAVLTYAGVFSEAHSYQTGNFVPEEEELPDHLDTQSAARYVGYKAGYSYSLDTYHDQEIWHLQKASQPRMQTTPGDSLLTLRQTLDEHIVNVAGFNPNKLARVEWQNGTTIKWRFQIKVPMFLSRDSRGGRLRPPAGLHPWVTAAHTRSRTYRANPVRPHVQAIENGVLRNIEDCTKKELEYGDVVGIIFTMVYSESEIGWGPVFMMTDIIRVMEANREAYPLETEPPVVERPRLSIGTTPEEHEQPRASLGEGMSGLTLGVPLATVVEDEGRPRDSVDGTKGSNSSTETLAETLQGETGLQGPNRRSPTWDMEVDSETAVTSTEGGPPRPMSPTGQQSSVEPIAGTKRRRRQDDESQENVPTDIREFSDVGVRGKRGSKPGRRSVHNNDPRRGG